MSVSWRLPVMRHDRYLNPPVSVATSPIMTCKRTLRKCVKQILQMKSRMGFHFASFRCIVLLVTPRRSWDVLRA
jgi:hypothetical protein